MLGFSSLRPSVSLFYKEKVVNLVKNLLLIYFSRYRVTTSTFPAFSDFLRRSRVIVDIEPKLEISGKHTLSIRQSLGAKEKQQRKVRIESCLAWQQQLSITFNNCVTADSVIFVAACETLISFRWRVLGMSYDQPWTVNDIKTFANVKFRAES